MLSTRSDADSVSKRSSQRRTWAVALDALGLPLILFGSDGHEIRRTAAFRTILTQAQTPIRRQILKTANQVALQQLDRAQPRPAGAALEWLAPDSTPARILPGSDGGGYIVRTACIDGPDDFGTPLVIIVAVERRMLRLPSPQALRDRFGLTQRESEVALLLAQRRQNREIAEMLCISVHTARHHTERVLEKLAIPRRTRVIEVLQDMNAALPGVLLLGVVKMQSWVTCIVGVNAWV